MVFKLVRTDCAEPRKIQLPVGQTTIGRGQFLDCDDKRVSRQHGEISVSEDSVIIKALHQNPCFYIKKGNQEVQILKQNFSFELNHGDKFGLLPDIFWFEVLHCTSIDTGSPTRTSGENQESRVLQNGNENTQVTSTNGIGDRTVSGATEIQDERQDNENVFDEDLPNIDFNDTIGDQDRAESPSMINAVNAREESPLRDTSPVRHATSPPIEQPPPEPSSPAKRSHSPEPMEDVSKKVKTEPVEVKQEPLTPNDKPGPSQMQAPNIDPSASAPSAAPVGRERCWYGASCYRKNPQHKKDFSHPSDSDRGGSSGRVQCPYGRQCRKTDPRHWRDHDHPEGTRPPMAARAPPGMQVVQRHGNVFYINAHSVNFYDDHFRVEDSDGDSVDFDYEF